MLSSSSIMIGSDDDISKEAVTRTTLNELLMASDVIGSETQPLSHRKVLTILSNMLVRSMVPPDTAESSSLNAEKRDKDEKEIEGDSVTMNKDLEESISIVVKRLGEMGGNVGRKRICQHAFTQNDIVWICKTCQVDETCVLCNTCFIGSNHKGHEVFFYHSLSGGCCDCGDPEAWDENGFCKDHGIGDDTDPLASLSATVVSSGQLMISTIVSTLKELASEVRLSYTIDALNGESSKIRQQRDKEENPSALIFYNSEIHTPEEFQRLIFLAVPHVIKDDPALKTNGFSYVTVNRLLSSFSHGQEETEVPLSLPVGHPDVIRLVRTLTSEPFGFLISVRTPKLAAMCRRASTVVSWMLALSRTSSALCRLVAGQFDESSLEQLMLQDAYLPATLRHSLHDMYLELMADQPFKQRIAMAYSVTLLRVARDFAKGIGRAESCLNCLSVQFINRKVFVDSLIEKRRRKPGFLSDLCFSVLLTLRPAMKRTLKSEDGMLKGFLDSPWGASELDPSSPVLRSRRYHPALTDLRCIMNVDDVPRRFITDCLPFWLATLRVLNNVGGQRRVPRACGHVTFMSRDWINVWNICSSICMLFERVLCWISNESAAYSVDGLESSTSLFCTILSLFEEIHSHQEETLQRRARLRPSLWPDCLELPQLPCTLPPLKGGINERLLLRPPPAQRSFHPVLHRFFAAAVREACKSPNRKPLEYLEQKMGEKGTEFITWFLDAPLLTLELSSEVVAGVWTRNGIVLKEQVVNYLELPFCRIFRDLDVLAVQVAGNICGPRRLVNYILHRYRCWHFFYSGEVDRGLTWNLSPDIITAALDIDPIPQSDVHTPHEVYNRLRFTFAEPGQHEDEDEAVMIVNGSEVVVTMEDNVVNGNLNFEEETKYHDDTDQEIGGIDQDDQEHTTAAAMDESINDAVEERVEEQHQTDDYCGAASNDVPTQQYLRNRRGSDDISPGRLEADQQQTMGVECLFLFIRLIAEIPSPPDMESLDNGNDGANNKYIVNQLRREALHVLACGPASHSELEDVFSSILCQRNAISEGTLDEILGNVADVVEGGSLLEPGKYTLKTDLYEEYDPGFWHIPLAGHQKALERREEYRKARDSERGGESRRRPRPAPMCPPPRPVHPFFESFRIHLATEESLLRALKRLIEEGETTGPSTILSCALHLLTLAVHIVIEENGDSRNTSSTNPEEENNSGTDLNDTIMTCDPATTSTAAVSNETGRSRLPLPSLSHHFCNTLLSTGIVTSLVNLSIKGLLDCDFTTLAGVNWLLQQLYRMHDGCRMAIPASCREDEENAEAEVVTTELAYRKRSDSARARVLAAVREQAALFEAGNKERGLDEIMDGAENGTARDTTTVSLTRDTNTVQCIVCHEVVATHAACVKGDDDERRGSSGEAPLVGRIVFIQRSTVLGGAERPGLHVQSCGHALHQECFHQYFITVAEQQEAGRIEDPEMSMVLNLTKGEFKCPMCKTVANSFVPWGPSLHSDQPLHKLTSYKNDMSYVLPITVLLDQIKSSRLQVQRFQVAKAETNGVQRSYTRDNLAGSDTNGAAAIVDEKQTRRQLPSSITNHDHSTAPSTGTCSLQEASQNFLLNLREVECSGASSVPSPVELQDVFRGASAAAYTASSLLAELKACLPGGGDEVKRAMGVTLLFECLRMAFQQPLLSEKIHSTLISILENGWANTGGSAELRQSKKPPAPPVSLLERNLLEILVMLFCILPKEGWPLALTTMCVARGVQVCLSVKLRQQRGMASATAWLHSEPLKDSMLGKSCDIHNDEHAKILDKCLRDSLDPFRQVVHLLMELFSCEDVAALPSALNRFGEGLLQNGAASDAVEVAASHSSFWCPSSLAEMRKAFEGPWGDIVYTWVNAALVNHVGQQPQTVNNTLDLIIHRQGDWPSAVATNLHSLPQSYTELHSQLNAAGSGKRVVNPAICLSCGSIGPAQSSFYISHVKMCGLGCGIFFLQKECNSLLINGNHVMFYTSPYVDTHGENLTCKGKPLFLDERRLGLLHGLLLRHLIPQTIIQI